MLCIWHHCTYNSTISDAVQLHTLQLASLYLQHQLWFSTVTYRTVGITVPTTTLALMQYIHFLPDISIFHWHAAFSAFIFSSLNRIFTFLSKSLIYIYIYWIYKPQYTTLPYQATVQALSSRNSTDRNFISCPILKFSSMLLEGHNPQ
jgi:hypothetical protein